MHVGDAEWELAPWDRVVDHGEPADHEPTDPGEPAGRVFGALPAGTTGHRGGDRRRTVKDANRRRTVEDADRRRTVEDANRRRTVEDIARRVEPTVLAIERSLPVDESLQTMLPEGLQRGSTIGVEGIGSRSLLFALLSSATRSGSWCALVGGGDLGLAAAADLGVALRRVALVDAPDPQQWGEVVGALVGAVDLVVVAPTHRVKPGDARRLTARARERGSVLLHIGDAVWPNAHDVVLRSSDVVWEGLHYGFGRLQQRRMTIEVAGRRGAARKRSTTLLLPSTIGGIELADRAHDTEQDMHDNIVPLRRAG